MAADGTVVTRRSVLQLTGAAFVLPANQPHSSFLENGRMQFTPKFVDLVRNVATVTGTDSVALGAAVSGFSSLADAVSAGEQFYYCIQGVDKPQEREVGRGTMQADGRVARQAIGGDLTNFTGGSKTIGLVSPAEWFERLEQLSGEAVATVATPAELASRPARAAGPLYLREAGREGLFLFDGSSLPAEIAADSAQGIYVVPASDPTGASGAWVRQFAGPVNPGWFGLSTANTGAQNDTAIAAMFATLRARSANSGAFSRSVEAILFPAGLYNFDSTIELTEGTWIIEGGGAADDSGAILKFAPGVTGIRVQRYNTEGAAGTRAAGRGGDRSIIRNLVIDGANGGAEAEAHGVQLRAAATLHNLVISDFQGDGVHINAIAGGTPAGNANNFTLRNVRCIRNRRGLFLDGADSNSGIIDHCDFTSNRTWGVEDSSFLGNTYIACHAAANGWDGAASSIPTGCSHGGNRYYVRTGQAVWCSTNAPTGTTADNQGWGYIGAGGSYSGVPIWTSGTTFREGGAYRTDNPNAANLFLGCYSEGDQNPSQLINPSMVVGGLHGAAVRGGAAFIRGTTQGGTFAMDGLRIGGPAAPYLDLIAGGFEINDTYQLMPQGNDIVWTVLNSGIASNWSFRLTGESTTASVGKRRMDFPNGFGLADKKVLSGTAAPTGGTYVRGDMMFNSAPTAGGPMGWMCVTGGSPGTWKAMGNLAA